MNLKTFKKYLEKNNISAIEKLFGEEHFFYNAPGYIYEALTADIQTKTAQEAVNKYNQVVKYCNKYNLDVFLSGRLSCDCYGIYHYWLTVRTQEQKAASENYYLYRDAAKEECEILMHEYHEAGLYKTMHKTLNKQLRAIMDNYGSIYNQSLIHAVKTA